MDAGGKDIAGYFFFQFSRVSILSFNQTSMNNNNKKSGSLNSGKNSNIPVQYEKFYVLKTYNLCLSF